MKKRLDIAFEPELSREMPEQASVATEAAAFVSYEASWR
jgi:hypothetical protein